MIVQAFETRAVAANSIHAWGGVAGEDEPFGIERVELRVYDRATKRDHVPTASVRAADRDSIPAILLDGGSEPFAVHAGRAFTKLGAGGIDDAPFRESVPVKRPHGTGPDEENGFSRRMNGRRERVNRRAIGKLADFTVREHCFEELGRAGAIRRKHD